MACHGLDDLMVRQDTGDCGCAADRDTFDYSNLFMDERRQSMRPFYPKEIHFAACQHAAFMEDIDKMRRSKAETVKHLHITCTGLHQILPELRRKDGAEEMSRSAIRLEQEENERITCVILEDLNRIKDTGLTYDQCILIRELMYWSHEKGISDKRMDLLQTHDLLMKDD